jgi:hypothetical protein
MIAIATNVQSDGAFVEKQRRAATRQQIMTEIQSKKNYTHTDTVLLYAKCLEMGECDGRFTFPC